MAYSLTNMKPTDILVVTTHSFVDLITNSSSELFVSNGKKTVDAVKELLAALLKNHNDLTKEDHSFESVFGEIETPKYVFNYWGLPRELTDEYIKYKEYGCPFYERHHFSSDNRPVEMSQLCDLEHEISLKHKSWEKGISEKEAKKRHEASRKETDALWTDWGVRAFLSEMGLFREFLKQNNFDNDALLKFDRKVARIAKQHQKESGGRYLYPRFSGKIQDAWDTFTLYEGYGIQVKPDSIIIRSASDNTIPYELMDTITAYLNASRFHIG